MNWKWLETSTQHEANAGDGGGGGDAPAPAEGEGTPDDGPPASEGIGPPDSGAAPAPTSTPAEPGPVEFPSLLDSVFTPLNQPPQGWYTPPGYTPPPAPGGPPERPTAEMWQMEPEKAAAMQQKFTEFVVDMKVRAATQPINEIREGLAGERRQKYQNAVSKAKESQRGHYENVFNRDKEFRANAALQQQTEKVVGEFLAGALNQVSQEDMEFASTSLFAHRALAMAKADLKHKESYAVPLNGPGVVGAQGMKAPPAPLIDEEVAKGLPEAGRWAGTTYTPEQIAAAQKRRDDSEW